jgi:hypothetical protein
MKGREHPVRARIILVGLFAALLGLIAVRGMQAAPTAKAKEPDSFASRTHVGLTNGNDNGGGLSAPVAENFKVLGHNDLGALDTNGDVFVHGNFAYVGTWAEPCTGRGVKIVDVSKLKAPRLIGTLAARSGTSAEDMVVRSVSTRFFRGDLLGVGIQRCGSDPSLDSEQFGVEFWDVSNPRRPQKLSFLGVTNGSSGVHELDLFQRGGHVYALLATPFTEWFDPVPGGDFRIVDVTNPRGPAQVGQWGAGAHGLSPGPYFGQGSFGSRFAHSARASRDGTKAYVSYWDLGILTFDISDVTNPVLLSRTTYPSDADGDGHSVSVYRAKGRTFLLTNDEDFDPTSPAHISFGTGAGIAPESAGGTPLWLQPGHALTAAVVAAANDGCTAGDYPSGTTGKIVVVHTPFPFFDPVPGPDPLCDQGMQDTAAAAAGAAAVVHDFVATATSPQYFDFTPVDIPVLFTDHATAQGMIAAGSATLAAQMPSWGFMRVFDANTGTQVAKFDSVPNVHELPPPVGFWSIHNNEISGDRSYASWYSNGIVAIDLRPLTRGGGPRDPVRVGQFVPPGGTSPEPGLFPDGIPIVWGVAIRHRGDDGPVIFASDMLSGLWIVRPTGAAKPNDD